MSCSKLYLQHKQQGLCVCKTKGASKQTFAIQKQIKPKYEHKLHTLLTKGMQ